MKKVVSLLTMLFCITIATKAQDLIVKNDKTEIKAKVLEITEDAIKYKKFEMQDGPTYSIAKRDVFMIVYANGTKEYIESAAPTPPKAITETPVVNSNANISSAMQSNTGNYQSVKVAASGSRNHTSFGINAGVVSSTTSFTNNDGTKAIIGFRAGIVLDIPVSNHFSITPELNYLKKGFGLNKTSSNDESNFRFTYIELPINFSYISGEGTGLIIGIAPTFAYGIGAVAENTTKNTSASGSFSELNAKPFEISGSAFIGYKFPKVASLKITYNSAFTDMNFLNVTPSKNQYLALGMTFLF